MAKSAGYTIIRELIEKHPDLPARTLARMAFAEHPTLWRDLEACRLAVRTQLGVAGAKQRKDYADKSHFRPPRKAGWSDVIPESIIQIPHWGAVQVDGKQRTGIINDVHIPFHDEQALEIALDHLAKKKPTCLLLNGDQADHYGVPSKWVTDPRLRDFPGEVLAVKKYLAGLRKRFGRNCRIIYKHGNHEERYNRCMMHRFAEFLGIPEFEWEAVFHTEEYDIEVVKDKRPVRLGKLNVLHGHEYPFPITNPVNPGRGLFLKANVHAACGHFHRVSFHPEKNLEEKVIGCWSMGCLCDLHPAYAPINKWEHGFGYCESMPDGTFQFDNLRILHGKVY